MRTVLTTEEVKFNNRGSRMKHLFQAEKKKSVFPSGASE